MGRGVEGGVEEGRGSYTTFQEAYGKKKRKGGPLFAFPFVNGREMYVSPPHPQGREGGGGIKLFFSLLGFFFFCLKDKVKLVERGRVWWRLEERRTLGWVWLMREGNCWGKGCLPWEGGVERWWKDRSIEEG